MSHQPFDIAAIYAGASYAPPHIAAQLSLPTASQMQRQRSASSLGNGSSQAMGRYSGMGAGGAMGGAASRSSGYSAAPAGHSGTQRRSGHHQQHRHHHQHHHHHPQQQQQDQQQQHQQRPSSAVAGSLQRDTGGLWRFATPQSGHSGAMHHNGPHPAEVNDSQAMHGDQADGPSYSSFSRPASPSASQQSGNPAGGSQGAIRTTRYKETTRVSASCLPGCSSCRYCTLQTIVTESVALYSLCRPGREQRPAPLVRLADPAAGGAQRRRGSGAQARPAAQRASGTGRTVRSHVCEGLCAC